MRRGASPGTRLGLWTHFVTQFSGLVFGLLWGYPFLVQGEGRSPQQAAALLTLLVVARWPSGRSSASWSAAGPTAARCPRSRSSAPARHLDRRARWPGRAPLALLVVLVLVLATNGPGSMVGFDYARTENEPARLGSATGIVNVGGFVASLTTILLIGLLLNLEHPGGTGGYTLGDFRVAFSVQYLVWAVGAVRRHPRAPAGCAPCARPSWTRSHARSCA